MRYRINLTRIEDEQELSQFGELAKDRITRTVIYRDVNQGNGLIKDDAPLN